MKGGVNIKVLHIISGNDNGGGGKHVLNICDKSNKKFQNIIACLGEGPLYLKAKELGVSYKLFSKKLYNMELVKFINHNSISIVNFHGAKPFLLHLILKSKLNVPTVAVVHSDFRYDFLNNKLKYFIFTPLSTRGLKSFKNYICVSNNLKSLLEDKKIEGKISVVNNGIDIKSCIIGNPAKDIRNSLKIKDNEFVYVMVARLHPIKNHKEVILAFKKLILEFHDVKLLLVGGGELDLELKNLVEELKLENEVIMVGNVFNPLDYINASNVSILASLSEGGAPPLTVLESGIVKKPLIYTQVGDLECILDDNSGYKIKDKDNVYIYMAMREAYLDKGYSNVKGENLHNIVINNFTIENFWEKYYEIYKNILKK
ncbi:glycosyltransferase [Clostridium estertheticum]|uniref:glycosyltransferase n=1 Tax=Clostridium estertheticum TaxID=238834 RepID=UPI001C0B60BC|nr:glycosyltransferase [Clostridium estertheticum]MBU3198942.1 glycosyltransferase [Clostridium estertheticum]WAG68072.1 glycosyltransferase [Clostridium estertheticum]